MSDLGFRGCVAALAGEEAGKGGAGVRARGGFAEVGVAEGELEDFHDLGRVEGSLACGPCWAPRSLATVLILSHQIELHLMQRCMNLMLRCCLHERANGCLRGHADAHTGMEPLMLAARRAAMVVSMS